MEDKVFQEKVTDVADFHFGEKVASAFDDMVERSVPFYAEMQRMIRELAGDFAVGNTNFYDLGCSTGTSMLLLDQHVDAQVKFIGVDNSEEMLNKCRSKLAEHKFTRPHELRCADLNQGVAIENASMVLMNLTLQFIRPLHRDKLVKTIHDAGQAGENDPRRAERERRAGAG